MPAVAQVTVHLSQFPDRVRKELLESLRTRRVNHKFHYESLKQTQKWLALHEAYSPARTDADCAATYEASFVAAAQRINASTVHVIGLGCGGGQKDTRLLQLLRQAGKQITYTPSDVSVPMVLVARAAALAALPELDCRPFVCDLASMEEIEDLVASPTDATSRLITFFGMIPNFEPSVILLCLASWLGPEDFLLFSANLAPGPDYAAGVRHVLPSYDNDLTRDWLLTFLLDVGVERTDGELRFSIEDTDHGLKRIIATFEFSRARSISVDSEHFDFSVGEKIRLFFSYRHTPQLVRELLAKHGLAVLDQWITKSGEEGVFLCRRT